MTTITRRTRTEFGKDPARFALHFRAGIGLPALVVEDWTRCPARNQSRSHWTGPTTCRCNNEEDTSQ